MNFRQDGVLTKHILKSLEVMIRDGQFAAETLIVDGYDFSQSSPEDLRNFRKFAERMGLEVWYSASLKGDEPLFDEQGVPYMLEKFLEEIDVLISIGFKDEYVRLTVVKNHDQPAPGELPLKLDLKTLLIAEDK